MKEAVRAFRDAQTTVTGQPALEESPKRRDRGSRKAERSQARLPTQATHGGASYKERTTYL
eukprot:5253163-Pleurochrysis_carterae.AAC.2